MNKNLKLILIIIIPIALMFATSLLLDLQLVQDQLVRKFIIYLLIAIEAFIGFVVFKAEIK